MDVCRMNDFVDTSWFKKNDKVCNGIESSYNFCVINRQILFVATSLDCLPLGSERILSDHLMFIWEKWEPKVKSISKSGEVPVHDMSKKGNCIS